MEMNCKFCKCRVYLVGGAEATGSPNDTAVVYTPAFHEYDAHGQRRVYVWNVTLPQHFFSRAPVDPEQGTQTLLLSKAQPLTAPMPSIGFHHVCGLSLDTRFLVAAAD